MENCFHNIPETKKGLGPCRDTHGGVEAQRQAKLVVPHPWARGGRGPTEPLSSGAQGLGSILFLTI